MGDRLRGRPVCNRPDLVRVRCSAILRDNMAQELNLVQAKTAFLELGI